MPFEELVLLDHTIFWWWVNMEFENGLAAHALLVMEGQLQLTFRKLLEDCRLRLNETKQSEQTIRDVGRLACQFLPDVQTVLEILSKEKKRG